MLSRGTQIFRRRDKNDSGLLDTTFPDAVDRYYDRLLRAAWLRTGNADDARDVVQESFYRALKAISRFRGGSSLYTWLYAIMRNVCSETRRGKTLFSIDPAGLTEGMKPLSGNPETPDMLLRPMAGS